jgi:hypothetical protein
VLNGRAAFASGGTAVPPPATCGALALNNRSHVLCTVSGVPGQDVPYVRNFAIWDGRALIPLAAADTFGTSIFYAWTLNDADAVAGSFTYQPSFGNPLCSTAGACDVIWRNGEPTFLPPVSYFGYTRMTDRFMLVQTTAGCHDRIPIYLYDVGTGVKRQLDACPSYASDMNAQGWVVGTHRDDRFAASAAVLYRPEGDTPLGNGEANGVNDAGVVVGTVDGKAFMWKDGATTPLTFAAADTNWTVTGAQDINNRGQILAQADDSVHGKLARSVILTPTSP